MLVEFCTYKSLDSMFEQMEFSLTRAYSLNLVFKLLIHAFMQNAGFLYSSTKSGQV